MLTWDPIFQNQTKGLFGNWSNDPSDDFVLPDGTQTNVDILNSESIYDRFGIKCESRSCSGTSALKSRHTMLMYVENRYCLESLENIPYEQLFADPRAITSCRLYLAT